jgi:putative endonuclease
MTLTVGRRGEQLAEEYMLAHGAKLLERNFHVRYAEVDRLFLDEGELVALEVKARDVHDLAAPEECVFVSQLRRIVRDLMTYAQDNDMLELPMRVDVIAIVFEPDGSVLRLDHLRSVYPA